MNEAAFILLWNLLAAHFGHLRGTVTLCAKDNLETALFEKPRKQRLSFVVCIRRRVICELLRLGKNAFPQRIVQAMKQVR